MAVKKENCPHCNEPTVKMSLRSDYIPKGGGLPGRCIGQLPADESIDIEIERHSWKKIESEAKFFEDRK